ncbi:MAG TPA: hypothetical protein VHC18_19405 [Amycolatopsis sp.]|nr:hypothetical protein [Amycolatopsis sp.]
MDVQTAHRALPLWAKLLLTAGFAVAGWLLTTALGGFTASAAESPNPNTTHDTGHGPGLGRLLGGTLTTLTDTVRTTVDTTLTTVTSTVTTTVTTVTNVADTATETVAPVANTVLRPVTSSTAAPKHAKTSGSTTVTQTRADTTPAERPSIVVTPPSAAAVPLAHAEPAAPQPSRHQARPVTAVSKATGPAPDVQARDGAPEPAPTQPSAPSSAVSVSHDSGGTSRHPLAILTTHASAADLQSAGSPRRGTFVDSSRDPALPTTSPD